jgi:hypothetical protein
MKEQRPANSDPDPESGAFDDDIENVDEMDRWDANDPRRQHDQMAPPMEPCECYCLHCGRVFMSDQIWFQKVIGDKDGFDGFWMCPTPNCSGAGFTFDIFPTDPTHPANAGWHYIDDDEEEYDENGDPLPPESEWDPEEKKYKDLDALHGPENNDAEDMEGEEWKFGMQPGERPPEPDWMQQARQQAEEEERRYNAPDERPRELDWSNRDDRGDGSSSIRDDDIPF